MFLCGSCFFVGAILEISSNQPIPFDEVILSQGEAKWTDKSFGRPNVGGSVWFGGVNACKSPTFPGIVWFGCSFWAPPKP